MKSPPEKRKGHRVEFSRGRDVQIVAIDGTRAMRCTMLDVSQNGAKLRVSESVQKLNLREFFLLLTSTGNAYRRCELAWIDGDQIGVRFLAKGAEPRQPLARKTKEGG